MGIFDKLRRRGRDLAGQHGDEIDKGIDKGSDIVDKRTGGKHGDKIDKAAEKAKDAADDLGRDAGTQQRRNPGSGQR